MKRRTKALIAAGVLAVAGIGGGSPQPAVATTPTSGRAKRAAGQAHHRSGNELDSASTAALDHVGEGRVTETEVGDEESYYEVEVTKDDGSQVDVQLDRGFNVVGSGGGRGERRRFRRLTAFPAPPVLTSRNAFAAVVGRVAASQWMYEEPIERCLARSREPIVIGSNGPRAGTRLS